MINVISRRRDHIIIFLFELAYSGIRVDDFTVKNALRWLRKNEQSILTSGASKYFCCKIILLVLQISDHI